MVKQICLNGTWDDDKISSPMPTIGLYIAAGTSACLLFMICDLFHGLYNRKPWIPCRFLKLNSLTLTLLAIASKLPVDLTTSMPSVQDQLSKLSGTVLISISMCIFFPSLGSQSHSERLSNMLSLTIFVVTIVVNVCMQMVTGVIFLFIVEHVIIMSCMLLLLALLWFTLDFSRWELSHSSGLVDELEEKAPQNSESMIQILKSVYINSCTQNPEWAFIDSPTGLSVCMLSALCALVLSQAVLQSLVLKKVDFRCGISDYKWSMWIIVVTQFFTILVGSTTTIFRWLLTFVGVFDEMNVYEVLSTLSKLHIFTSWILSNLSKLRTISFFKISIRVFMIIFQTIKRTVSMVLMAVQMIMCFLSFLLYLMLKIPFMCAKKIKKKCFGEQRNGENCHMEEWIQRNCEYDMERWMAKYKRNLSTDDLIQLLSKTCQSEEPFINKVSCLSVVIFIRIATIALPDVLWASLICTFEEAFGIICFIDQKMNITAEEKNKLVVGKELWMERNNPGHWFHKNFIKPSVMKLHSQSQFQPPLDLYFTVIEELKRCQEPSYFSFKEECFRLSGKQQIKKDKYAVSEIRNICEFIIRRQSRQTFSSIDEVYGNTEQLFVDMLHISLSQLPLAIHKHLVESPIQEREERARLALKFLYKLEPLENKVHWSFPYGTGITSLITPRDPTIDIQRIEPVEGNVDANVAHRVIDGDELQELV